MKVITLTQEQIDQARSLATKIQDSKPYTRSWGAKNIAVGLLGEMAYAQMTNTEICTEVWNDKCDGGIDFKDGADVKTITWLGANPELKVGRLPSDKTKKTKFVMAICDYENDPKNVRLIGEISVASFKQKAQLRTYGTKSWYAVTPEDLDVIYT